jgi:thiamine-phosphate pyrophosphorylase
MQPRGTGSQTPRPRPRIYVIAGIERDTSVLAHALGPASAAADIAAVLLQTPPGRPDADIATAVKALAPAVQGRGAALLLGGRPDLVASAGADGAHLDGSAALQAALPRLKPDRIAGAGGLTARHDAMLAAELGADYVMFGEPACDGRRPAFSAVLERTAWWAEIFETPCVAFASGLEDLSELAAAGADFVALADFVWNHPGGPAAALVAATEALGAVELA